MYVIGSEKMTLVACIVVAAVFGKLRHSSDSRFSRILVLLSIVYSLHKFEAPAPFSSADMAPSNMASTATRAIVTRNYVTRK